MTDKVAIGVGWMELPFADAAGYWRWVDMCEAGGVDSIWQTDRLISRTPILECMTAMAALAGRTRRMKFGMNVVSLALRDPVLLAKQCATIDVLSEGRLLPGFGIGSPLGPEWAALGIDTTTRGRRTDEGLTVIRRLWTEENVSFTGEHFRVTDATVEPRLARRGERLHPKLYFGGASEAAERVAAAEADVQLFWGEPLDGVAERIERLKTLSRKLDRDLPPLEFGLRITTFVRDTTEQAWAEAETKVAEMAERDQNGPDQHRRSVAVGQQRLLDLQNRGDVLDDNLYTAPGRYGGGGAGTTWLVGSAADVASSLRKYQALGITHFVLSDTPYLQEIKRQGAQLLPLLRQPGQTAAKQFALAEK